MIAVIKGDDGRIAGGIARDLYSIFHRFSATMPDVHHANTTCKVDVAITIDILDNSPFGLRRKYRHGGSDTARYKLLATRQQLTRFFSGNVQIRLFVRHGSLLE